MVTSMRHHHQSLEKKASLAPTNEPSLAYLEFLWNQYALSVLWLFITCTAEVMSGLGTEGVFSSNVKQKLPGSIPRAKKRLRRIKKSLLQCMNHLHALKQPSALGKGRWSKTSIYHVMVPVVACDPCSTDKAFIWRHSLSPVPVVPSPKDHEWGINVDEQLVIQWMCSATAPDTVLQLMFSVCKR